MAMPGRYRCSICPFFAADTFTSVIRHIGSVHAFEPGFSVTCGIDGCQATYKKFSSYKTHFYRKHRRSEVLPVETTTNEDVVHCACVEDFTMYSCDASEPDAQDTAAVLRDSGAKFILRMKEGLSLSQTACDEMISGVTELFSGYLSHLHQSLKGVCDTAGLPSEEVCGNFRNEMYNQPFNGLSTRYLQHQYFRQNFGLLVELIFPIFRHCHIPIFL